MSGFRIQDNVLLASQSEEPIFNAAYIQNVPVLASTGPIGDGYTFIYDSSNSRWGYGPGGGSGGAGGQTNDIQVNSNGSLTGSSDLQYITFGNNYDNAILIGPNESINRKKLSGFLTTPGIFGSTGGINYIHLTTTVGEMFVKIDITDDTITQVVHSGGVLGVSNPLTGVYQLDFTYLPIVVNAQVTVCTNDGQPYSSCISGLTNDQLKVIVHGNGHGLNVVDGSICVRIYGSPVVV